MAYELVEPTLIENTTTRKYINSSGVFRAYYITPNEGYVLHDNALDWYETNPETHERELKLGYTGGTASCASTYDFEVNPREFYAVLESSVSTDQIFGVGDNDHETA